MVWDLDTSSFSILFYEIFRVRLVVENSLHFPRMVLSFHFQFSMKILESAFG